MFYLLTIFLSAMLLFMVQPIIAKAILPWLGGGASVWTACMLFFQVFLLAGYCYAHLVTKLKTVKRQLMVHGVVVASSLIAMPLAVSSDNLVINPDMPETAIISLLLFSIGLPYFVLSSTGPLLQRWFSYQHPNQSPYRLYALSNVGSLLGLVAYPFLIEPSLLKTSQMLGWSLGYAGYVLCVAVTALRLIGVVAAQSPTVSDKINYRQLGMWIGLSMLGVILLLAITNAMTQNIASVPFLWLLPLTIYLLTFILCFANDKYYVKTWWNTAFVLVVLASFLLYFFAGHLDFIAQVSMFSLILLVCCMVCHGELARLKPPTSRLTLYYLAISFGGFLGGLSVSIIAPKLFSQFSEFPLAIYGVYLVIVCFAWRTLNGKSALVKKSTLALFAVALPIGFIATESIFVQHDVVSSRNFYGQLAVKDVSHGSLNERRLVDGTTSHGTQSLDSGKANIPLSYYRQGTGVALALQERGKRGAIKVGIIGLGAGTLAAYGRAGDHYQFYELNPQVKRYALDYFSYLTNTPAQYDVKLGDGRLSLDRELRAGGSGQFDVLVVDAFSSDAIPAHLLTREALALYRQHLKSDGVIAIHISNSHLDLRPLVRGLATDAGMQARLYLKQADDLGSNLAQWVLITNDVVQGELEHRAQPWGSDRLVLWTDDFSNLLSVLKW